MAGDAHGSDGSDGAGGEAGRAALREPARLPLVGASILSADFARLEAECSQALGAGADLLHLDVMDGHFVPNLTMGPDLCRGLRRALPGAALDVHLMVERPERFLEPFAEAGADHATVHIEAIGDQGVDFAERVRALGMTAGLAINPPTRFESIEAHIEAFDLILVMSVNPGFSGQSFIEGVLPKAAMIRERLRDDQRLQIDGGVKPENAGLARDAGCDVLVAASAIFGKPEGDRGAAIAALRGGEARAGGAEEVVARPQGEPDQAPSLLGG
ncbi:MAG: ribulose-phosphate 3-epimerase [Planctomycetota bacterium]